MTVEMAAPGGEESLTIEEAAEASGKLVANIERALVGKPQVVRWTVASVVADGHVLLEDVPGVGKTTLALALAKSVGLSFKRIQFTSDLLPGDIIGVSVYAAESGEFRFEAGPIFSGLVLADEINRTTPRTQSALLEAMSEGSVSVDNETRELPSPFVVIATQNPLDQHGTYPLPESQLDRFLTRLSIGYPAGEVEREMLQKRGLEEPVEGLEKVMGARRLQQLQRRASQVEVGDEVVDYVLEVVGATREHGDVEIGVSPRGGLALMRMIKAIALMEGRDYAVPDDAREVFVPCLAHRLSLGSGHQSREASEAVMESIVHSVTIPV